MKIRNFLFIVLFLCMFTGCQDWQLPGGIDPEAEVNPGERVNLIINGGFESGSFYPDQWFPDAWSEPCNVSWETGAAPEGSRYIQIQSDTPNDVRWLQNVRVEPYTDYILSAWIKTEGVDCSWETVQSGATVGVFSSWLMSPPLLGSHDWTWVTFRFNSRREESIPIACRLGTWFGVTTGTASFDDVRLYREP